MKLTPTRRKAVYRVLVAVGALLIVYGLVQPGQVDAWLQVASAALLLTSNELAARNVEAAPDALAEDELDY